MTTHRFIGFFLLIFGLTGLLSLFFINRGFLTQFTADGILEDFYLRRISHVQRMIITLNSIYILLGLLFFFIGKNISDIVKIKQSMLYFFFAFLWSFLMCEFLLRVKPFPTSDEESTMSVWYQPSAFSKYQLNLSQNEVKDIDGRIAFRMYRGFHNEKFPIQKPKGEIRILFCGGSFSFSDHQPINWKVKKQNHNWVAKIQEKLQLKGFNNVRVINASVPGYASFDSFSRILSELHFLKPDYIFFCHGWNDIKYFKDLKPEKTLNRIIDPLTENSPKKSSVFQKIMDHSQIYLYLQNIIENASDKRKTEGNGEFQKKQNNYPPFGISQFALNLMTFVDLCRNIDCQPVLLTQPRLVSPHNSTVDKDKIRYSFQGLTDSALLKAFYQIDSVIKEISILKKCMYYDLSEKNTGKSDLFVDHIHLTEKGGEVISSELEEFIEKNIVSDNNTE